MAIIKKGDIVEKGILNDLNKSLETTVKLVEKLTKELVVLQKKTREVNKTGSGSEAQKRNELTRKLTTTTKQLTDALTAEERVEKQIIAANKKLNDSYTKQAKDLALVKQRTLEQNKALREQAKATLKVKKGLSSLTKQMFAGVGIIAGLRLLGNVLKDAFKTFTEFSKAGSGLAAILNTTKKEVKLLTDQAKKLGATTAFTATQVIKLQTELARLGFSIREIKDSTPAILDLGAALGVNLADAAAVAGGVVRAFGLSTKDTKEVVDSMVATMNNSGASFEDYREAVKLSAPIFKAANIDFKTMNLLIGNLADSQIKGSIAGTGLKNLVSKLSDENSKLSKELGFTVKNSDDLVRAFEVLKTKNIDLTAATELTDERSKAAFLTLIQGVDSADKLSVALNNLDDNAKKTAETMLNNVAGDITKATSAWEGFVLSVADGDGIISRAVRSIVQGFTGILTSLRIFNEADISTKLKQIANGFASITGVGADYRFEITEQTKALQLNNEQSEVTLRLTKEQKEAQDKTNTSTETAAEKTKRLADETKRLAEIEKKRQDQMKSSLTILGNQIKLEKELADQLAKESELDDILAANEDKLDAEQDFQDKKVIIQDKAAEDKKKKDEEIRAAEFAIREQFETSIVQLASDIFSAFQDEKLAKINSDADAQKAILQQRLDDGVISEEQFAAQVAAIEKEQRIASAKADRKKALFDIAISTAVGIVKALAALNPALAITIGTIGAIQAGVVLGTPLPLNKGMVKVPGQGNTDTVPAVLTPGESVINKGATSNSEGILNMVNDGILTDKGFNKMTKDQSNGLILSQLMKGNQNSNEMINLLGQLGIVYTKNGLTHIEKANGSNNHFLNK